MEEEVIGERQRFTYRIKDLQVLPIGKVEGCDFLHVPDHGIGQMSAVPFHEKQMSPLKVMEGKAGEQHYDEEIEREFPRLLVQSVS